jgi:hypothetical protein
MQLSELIARIAARCQMRSECRWRITSADRVYRLAKFGTGFEDGKQRLGGVSTRLAKGSAKGKCEGKGLGGGILLQSIFLWRYENVARAFSNGGW